MKKRRFLASLLAVVMLLSVLPAGALAAPTETGTAPETKGNLFLDKEAILEPDGSYTIKMEAYSTGTSTTITQKKGVPMDVILVLDQSGSMAQDKNNVTVNGVTMTRQELLKKNVAGFINSVYADGQENHVTHRVGMVGFASGPLEGSVDGIDYNWLSTGVFDENGTFVGYQQTGVATMIHVPFNGELVQDGEYYVHDGNGYVKLTYDGAAQKYTQVVNPDTGRTDLFGAVNGKYEPATHGKYELKTQATNPTHGDGNTYYDTNGNPLTWKEVDVPAERGYRLISGTIEQGKTYYILSRNNYLSVSYDGSTKEWTDSKGSTYTVSDDGKQFYWPGGIFGFGAGYYDAYEYVDTPATTKWVLTTDGTQELPAGTKVYTHETKTGWNVNGTPVTELYEKTGTGSWVYRKNNQQIILSNEQVYVLEQGKNSYSGALVPVSTGENGQGEKRQSLVTATDSILAEGATRPALGIDMANRIFQENPLTEEDVAAGRQRVVIVFTDGVPGYNGYDSVEADRAVAESYITKNTYGAKVYTIGLFNKAPDPQTVDFLSHLSSNYPNANTQYTETTNYVKNRTYIACINGGYAKAKLSGGKWSYLKYVDDQGKDRWVEFKIGDAVIYEDTQMVPGDRLDPSKDYSAVVTEPGKLAEIFQTITQDITSSSTSVDLNDKSVIRDIMPEKEFGLMEMDRELTDASTVTVEIVPGAVQAESQEIVWGETVPVLTMTHQKENPTTGGATQSAPVNVNDVDMTIKATTYTINPKTQQEGPHTVDVTGFDYSKQFIAPDHPGAKLVITIKGLRVLPTASTDKVISTNRPESGLWKQPEAGTELITPEVAFQMPTTYFPSKTYVLDYAKPMDIPVKDLKMTAVENLDENGFNPFDVENPTLTIDHQDGKIKYGKAEVTDGKLTYTPQTTKWDGGDTFYAFGKVDTTDAEVDGATANQFGKAWAKVTVIPANNVYFEDTFETSETTGTVGITYTGKWDEIKESVSGDNSGTAEDVTDPGDNHGWIPALGTEKGDTDGSSHHADVTGNQTATASFTFTGTGVDIYSRTNGQTGTVMATLADADGKTMVGKIVDTLSVSDEYYQIPTLTFHEDASGNALPYGTYTVTINVTTAAKDRYEYYLDGIRVYNPAQGNADVTDKYEPEEQNATFVEVRDVLLDAASFSAENGTSKGFVFIDQVNDGDGNPAGSGNTDQVLGVGTYEDLGPKNEVYLKNGQSISFKVNNTDGNHYYVGLKSPTGATVGVTGSTGAAEQFNVTHTADMYYKIGPTAGGIITITNMSKGEELLSITKLRVTNEAAAVSADELFAPIGVVELLEETQIFYKAVSQAPVNPDATEPETTEPETQPTEPEATEPEVAEPTTPNVDIINPEPVKPSKPVLPSIAGLLEKVFGGFRRWF